MEITASEAEINSAYRKLALQHHPDRNPENKVQAEVNFKKISEAVDVLRDPQKRMEYDKSRRPDLGERISAFCEARDIPGWPTSGCEQKNDVFHTSYDGRKSYSAFNADSASFTGKEHRGTTPSHEQPDEVFQAFHKQNSYSAFNVDSAFFTGTDPDMAFHADSNAFGRKDFDSTFNADSAFLGGKDPHTAFHAYSANLGKKDAFSAFHASPRIIGRAKSMVDVKSRTAFGSSFPKMDRPSSRPANQNTADTSEVYQAFWGGGMNKMAGMTWVY